MLEHTSGTAPDEGSLSEEGVRRPGGDARARVLEGKGGCRLNTNISLRSDSHTHKRLSEFKRKNTDLNQDTFVGLGESLPLSWCWAHKLMICSYVRARYEVDKM